MAIDGRQASLFFGDGQRSIDFVLIYKPTEITDDNMIKLENYLDNLLRTGLDLEVDTFSPKSISGDCRGIGAIALQIEDLEKIIKKLNLWKVQKKCSLHVLIFSIFVSFILKYIFWVLTMKVEADNSTIFVKIHASTYTVTHYANICDIEFTFQCVKYRPNIRPTFRFMATPLSLPDPEDAVFQRAPETVSGNLPTDITSAEKILVIHEMLSRTKFGQRYSEFGINRLLSDKAFTDAFPIHDGPFEWTESGGLTDRQLLAKYWGSPRVWYKEQPLNLIEKYYGAEVAFYFAWLGFYVKMLVPVSVLSIICVLYGLITLETSFNRISEEICNSNLIMCPTCHYTKCKFARLSNSCLQSHVSYLSDNSASITFAIIISFWSTIFMELWDRKECVLQLQWNLTQLEYDASMRPEYVQNAVYHRYSPITGEKEPYTPKSVKVARYILSFMSLILMLGIMILVTVQIMVYRITISLMLSKVNNMGISYRSGQLIASLSGSTISAISIIIFTMIYSRIAMKLTKIENHRTQHEFDNGYIYKTYALAFTNNYSAVFYIAFFKGRLFTHPGDLSLWTTLGGIGSDICGPSGCLAQLGIQLGTIMVMKIFVTNYMQLIKPRLVALFQRRKNKASLSDLPAYEREYLMAPTDRYFLINEYMDNVIQYGFVVFFVAGFPLLPLFALIDNFVDLRVDSYNMTRNLRRPVPNKVPGLGAWHGILQAVTYIGVVTNALVIAFTSDFVPREIYGNYVDKNFRGFVNTTISAFDASELDYVGPKPVNLCFYPGQRYPPGHAKKYQRTTDFWYILAMRFLAVVIFEHVVMSLKGILAYVIPDVPSYVSEQIAFKERENKEIRMKVLNDTYMEERRRAGVRTSIVEPIDLDILNDDNT